MNILTFDTEEWFHLLENDSTRSEAQWVNFEKRIEGNVGRIIDILDSTDTKATFFVIGWVAKRYPAIVKRIAERFEVGSHTMNHQPVWQQTPEEFRKDVEESIKRLEDITGKKVIRFRAPGFSIRETEGWAYGILNELGITTDCSVFPAVHAHGGMPSYPTNGPAVIEYGAVRMKEFPITFKTIAGKHIIFSGGGYFRLFPYRMIKEWSRESSDYLMAYIHPRDMDANQPLIKDLGLFRRFKSYYGLAGAERKLRKWLTDFRFIDLATAEQQVDWDKVQKVRLPS